MELRNKVLYEFLKKWFFYFGFDVSERGEDEFGDVFVCFDGKY